MKIRSFSPTSEVLRGRVDLKKISEATLKKHILSRKSPRPGEVNNIKYLLNRAMRAKTVKITPEFCCGLETFIPWNYVSEFLNIDTNRDIFKKFPQQIRWSVVSRRSDLSADFIREFKDCLYWERVSRYTKLTPEIVEKCSDKIVWGVVIDFSNLPFEIVREYSNKLDWRAISKTCPSKDFIREFQDRLDWSYITHHAKPMTVEFVREFKDRIDWAMLARRGGLSYNIIDEFLDCFALSDLEYVRNINWKMPRALRDKANQAIRDKANQAIVARSK